MRKVGNQTWRELGELEEAWKKAHPTKVLHDLKGERLKSHTEWRKYNGLHHRMLVRPKKVSLQKL